MMFEELHLRYLLGESQQHQDYAIVQYVALDIEVRWSEQERGPYLARIGIELDGQPVAALVSPPGEGRSAVNGVQL